MSSKIPLYDYLRRFIERESASIPNRALPDLIAWSLGFKNYASATKAHFDNKVDLNSPDVVQKLLRQWKDGKPYAKYPDTALLEKLCSENKSPAISELDIEYLISALNMAIISYHPDELPCSFCKKTMVTTVDEIEFVTEAEDEDDIYAALCPECLAKELAKKRSERTIYYVDGGYRHV
jgi:hypothetical protein